MGEWMWSFLTSAPPGGEWSASRPGRFVPGTQWIGGWVSLRAGLDDLEKRKFFTLPGLQLGSLSRLARSQSLYRLSFEVISEKLRNFLLLILHLPLTLGPLACFPSELIWIYGSYRQSVWLLGQRISPVGRPLPTQGNTSIEEKERTFIPRVGFESTS
jgi:hypothetical protein